MPKIFATSLAGILIATLVLYAIGSIWYGLLFEEPWLASAGMTKDEATAIMDGLGPMMFVWGLLITLLQVLGLTYILNQSSASLLGTCVKICAIVAILIALPIMCYAHLYEGRPINGLFLDFGNVFIGYCVAGAILSFFRGKDAIGD